MKRPFIAKFLQSYLEKPVSANEENIIADWEKRNAGKLAFFASHIKNEEEAEHIMLQRIHQKIDHSDQRRRNSKYHRLLKIAAMLFIIGTCSVLVFRSDFAKPCLIINAPRGSNKFVHLPDGSRVWLHAGSTLKYRQDFINDREVNLIKGEAYFDVKHHSKSAFIVHHGNYYAKVLGTAFNVKAYGNRDVRVTVTRGKVEVGTKESTYTVLTPNKEIVLSKLKTQYPTIRKVDAGKITAWTSNEVNLYDMAFEDIIISIEDNYDVKIKYPGRQVKSDLATLHYSTKKNLSEVLEMIKMIYGLNYKIEGKEVYLSLN